MKLPVFDGNEKIGVLTVGEEGLYRVLSVRLPCRPGLLRLWLNGEGGGVCLGVLLPEGETLTLTRRFSRAEWKTLPHPLRSASLDAPRTEAEAAQPKGAPEPSRAESGAQTLRLFGRRFIVFRS